MDITFDFIKDNKFRKLGTTSEWPEKDNCYSVEVTSEKTFEEWKIEYFPIPLFDIVQHLKMLIEFSDCEGNTIIIKKLIENINEYGFWKYTEGYNNAEIDD